MAAEKTPLVKKLRLLNRPSGGQGSAGRISALVGEPLSLLVFEALGKVYTVCSRTSPPTSLSQKLATAGFAGVVLHAAEFHTFGNLRPHRNDKSGHYRRERRADRGGLERVGSFLGGLQRALATAAGVDPANLDLYLVESEFRFNFGSESLLGRLYPGALRNQAESGFD